ncbi:MULTISPECIES: hormogonium polysaccharide secretion pseudopilin HpsC [Nostocales]|uniref:Prepilin-type N-terminal cleavage/methylation domain-containing protein n=3 Tax=Nostocales TaxID=1161 RepID=A0A0C1ND05_9CYAN|nr:hormogonium polysaccharide secretion pseudopilin HpsC [Tolypothrix bouteillei]KAF3888447.1 prepilin-type N-terminal cleavage/methylation domain-containing protein [Tolypothrix bouteillei VB521301]
MKTLLRFILSTQFKCAKVNKKISGFTLIELLVAMILAALVITPLMAFMINVMDSERKEQAKVTTEQEIQAALDYIARDLQQAVYIYDADGVTRNNNSSNTSLSGIQDQIPPVKSTTGCSPTSTNNTSVCTPVLVFWKREFLANSVGVTAATQTAQATTDDGFAYSLVAYYLITNPSSTSPWSPAARIARFRIRGAVNAAFANSTGNDSSKSAGFKPPPLDLNISGAELKDKMNQWKTGLGAGASYDQPALTLVDYVSTTGPAVTCPTGTQGIGSSGFYACVNARELLARVYIRGTAMARLNNNNGASYTNKNSTYFPSASIQVQGRGFLSPQ